MNQKYIKILLPLLVLSAVLFIWGNSLAPADESTAQSLVVLRLIEPVLNLLPAELVADPLHLVRKAAHATEFAALGLLSFLVFSILPKKSLNPRPLYATLLCIAVAICDETIQYFIPGRTPHLTDVLLDSVSAAAAVLICEAIRTFVHQHRCEKHQ